MWVAGYFNRAAPWLAFAAVTPEGAAGSCGTVCSVVGGVAGAVLTRDERFGLGDGGRGCRGEEEAEWYEVVV